MHILAVDVGNSHTVIGLYEIDGRLVRSFRIKTDKQCSPDELYVSVDRLLERAGWRVANVDVVVLGTVVPELEHAWRKLFVEEKAKFLMADQKAPWSFQISIPHPEQLGADRMANAEGGLSHGAPFIVVDAGTATTFDVVGGTREDPRYLGGAIAPGVGISLQALIAQTSRLRAVSLSRSARGELPVVGNDTESAIRSGAIHGFAAMVDGMVARIIEEQGFPENIPVIATGGFSGYLREISSRVTIYSPDITLEGLYALAKRKL